MPKPNDNFLADAVTPKPKHITYQDGFRFGVGFFIGNVFLLAILGGLVWGIVLAFRLH